MRLQMHSIKKTLFAGDIQSLTLKTRIGEITVLDRHEPLVTVLDKCSVKVVAGDETHSFPIAGGFLEVRPGGELKLLADVEEEI